MSRAWIRTRMEMPPTQIGRALQELGITLDCGALAPGERAGGEEF